MIKKLKIRFIIVSLLSVLLVLSATIFAINTYNYVKIENEAQHSLTMVIDHGYDDKDMGMGPGHKPEEQNILREHYFIVSFDESGTITNSNFKHIFSISEEDGKNLALDVYNKDSNSGSSESFRYKKEVKGAETCIAFIDINDKISNFQNFLISSTVVSLISYAVLAALIVLASQIIFKTSEESYRKQKSFITNASHELKTPLTIISTDLEIIEMDHGQDEWTNSIRDQVNRLTTMTNQLVTLSKIEENDFKKYPFEDFSLTKLAKECLDSFLPTYKSRDLLLKTVIEDDLSMRANKFLINELFYIFLDNALKYTKDHGQVDMIIRKNKNKIELLFSNDIEENNQIDLTSLFERFYRSPDAKKEGSGIGLSIAKEIVDLHHGKIDAKIKDGKIIFTLMF